MRIEARLGYQLPGAEKSAFLLGLCLSAALLWGAGMRGMHWGMGMAFTAFLLLVSAGDLRYRVIFYEVLWPMGILGLLFNGIIGFPGIGSLLFGACMAGGFLWLLRWLSRGGMGGGDVKLAFVLGLWLPPKAMLIALFLAFLIGGLWAMALLARRGLRRGDRVAFGPFLSLGAYAAFLYGDRLWLAYQGMWSAW